MRLVALEMPDSPYELAGWLEQRLVGSELGDLVRELSSIQSEQDDAPSLGEILGDQAGGVCQHGLAVLTPEQLTRLLSQPQLLLELQEFVFSEGGSYWDRRLLAAKEIRDGVAQGREALQAAIKSLGSAGPATSPPAAIEPLPKSPPQSRRRAPWLLFSAAAVLLLAVGGMWVLSTQTTPQVAWGLAGDDAMPADATAPEYLVHLADAVDQWDNKRPTTRDEIAQRIGEFQSGCQKAIAAPHQPLSPADRQWLVAQCRRWSGQLEAHLASIQSGADPMLVRSDVDQLAQSMADALRIRAAEITNAPVPS